MYIIDIFDNIICLLICLVRYGIYIVVWDSVASLQLLMSLNFEFSFAKTRVGERCLR